MQITTQFSVYLINKPGVLADVTEALTKENINIVALALMDSGEHGALRMVCEDSDAARKVLSHIHDRWTECEVLKIELPNTPGAFAAAARKLADEHINITYSYATAGSGEGRTNAIFKVADLKKAQQILAGQEG